MKRVLLFVGILLALSAPVLAQTTTSVDPASYLPADTSIYAEIRTDSAGLSDTSQLLNFGQQLLNPGQAALSSDALFAAVTDLLPGINFTTDVLPWLGDHVGVAQLSLSADASNQIYVLPIRDASGAQAFVSKVTAGVTPQSVAGVNLYTTSTASLLVGSNVIWLGTPAGISQFTQTPILEHLSDNPQYQQVRAALPANADTTIYMSGNYIAKMLNTSDDAPPFAAYLQAALRLHPAQSAAEDALLKSPALNGIGLALQASANRIDVTGVVSVNAQYPAPTLTTPTAGTALLNLIPGNSFFVLDSYDVSTALVPLVSLAILGPSINSEFNNVVSSLESPVAVTPAAVVPMTGDELVAQAQPLIAQAESLTGLPPDQLYSLLDGEYALAVFPGTGPTIGAALYLQSSNPQQIIDALGHVSTLILTNPSTGQQLLSLAQETVSGITVTLVSEQSLPDRLALGIINKNVLFVTQESTLQQVLDSAKKQSPTTPAINWRGSFGTGQEAMFYADPRTIDLYNLREQRTPPLPMTAVAGSLDVQANGLFTMHVAITTGS